MDKGINMNKIEISEYLRIALNKTRETSNYNELHDRIIDLIKHLDLTKNLP